MGIIVSKARSLIDAARNLGWTGPPYDVTELASLAGLRVGEPIALPADEGAVLAGLSVLTNVDQAIVRQRFSICHEIAHTFFPDWQNAPHFAWQGARDPDHEVESLCQIGAAELIMPYWCFEAHETDRGVGFQSVIEVAERFVVSVEAAARRLISISNTSGALLVLGLGHRKSERETMEMPILAGFESEFPQPTAKLRVVRVAALSPSLRRDGGYVPTNKSIPDSSICYAAFDNITSVRARAIHAAHEVWDFGGLGACRVEAIGFHRGIDEPDGVIALIQRETQRAEGLD